MPKSCQGLVLDVDGTLLRGGSEDIDPRDAQAIRALIATTPVIVASGRTRFRLQRVLTRLAISEPVIALMGAHIFSPVTGHDEELFFVPPRDAERLIQWARNSEAPALLVTTSGTVALGRALPEMLPYFQPILTDNTQEVIPSQVLQIVFPNLQGEQELQLFEWAESQELNCLLSLGRDSIACTHLQADKGLALQRLAGRYQWDLASFVAIGNGLGDLTMFEAVGTSIAVGTRCPEPVKQSATDTVEGGPGAIADLITQYFQVV